VGLEDRRMNHITDPAEDANVSPGTVRAVKWTVFVLTVSMLVVAVAAALAAAP
jgi:hypothetical protein